MCKQQVHASAAKAAVDSITRTLALEWGEFGIRVNGVAPGNIGDTVGKWLQQSGPGPWPQADVVCAAASLRKAGDVPGFFALLA